MSQETEPLVTRGALGRMIQPVRARMIAGAVMSAFSAVFALIPFVAVAEAARLLTAGAPPGAIWTWVAVGAIGLVGRTLLYSGSLLLCHVADVDFVHLLRRSIVRHLRLLPLGWFTDNGSGSVKKLVTDDVTRIHVIVAHMAADLTSAILVPVVSLAYLLWVNVPFALALLGYVIAVFVLMAPSMQRGYTRYMEEWNRAQAGLSAATVELVDGIEVVKTFGSSSAVLSRFLDAVSKLTRVGFLWTAAMGRPAAMVTILFFPSTMVAVLAFGGWGAIQAGWMQPAELVPFLLVGVGLPAGYMQIAQLANGFRTAALGATSIERLLQTPPLPAPTHPQLPEDNTVVFNHVDFAYTPDSPVLTDVNLTLMPGTVTALVGASGSGKTTVTRLIPRFWDVSAGAVTIGGVDVRHIPTPELLRRIAMVFQDAVVVTDTVMENIRLGRPTASDDDVVTAARAAHIHERIMALPEGYDTVLGLDHGHLSGGELQRVTIARAILQDAPILLLDEATAHADPDSEVAIQQALGNLSAGRTMLVIAHRLATIVGVDQILVMDGGQIVERGTHAELLAQEGRYAQLWRAQNAATELAGGIR